MKDTYSAPTILARGEVVSKTLGSKPSIGVEDLTVKRPGAGSNLSFGL